MWFSEESCFLVLKILHEGRVDALTISFLFLLESDGSTKRCLVVALFVLLEVTGSNVLPL
jgi:hypothetical protein